MEQVGGVMYDDGLEEGAEPEMVGGMPVVNVDTGLAGTDGDEWDDDDWSEEGWDDKERY
jgi:hypothetical protein